MVLLVLLLFFVFIDVDSLDFSIAYLTILYVKGNFHFFEDFNLKLFVLTWLDKLYEWIQFPHIEDGHEVIAEPAHLALPQLHPVVIDDVPPPLELVFLPEAVLVPFALGEVPLADVLLEDQDDECAFVIFGWEFTARVKQHWYLINLHQHIGEEELFTMDGA